MSIGLFDWAVYTKMELDESLRGASRSWSISPPPLDPKSLEGGPESELAGGLRCHYLDLLSGCPVWRSCALMCSIHG